MQKENPQKQALEASIIELAQKSSDNNQLFFNELAQVLDAVRLQANGKIGVINSLLEDSTIRPAIKDALKNLILSGSDLPTQELFRIAHIDKGFLANNYKHHFLGIIQGYIEDNNIEKIKEVLSKVRLTNDVFYLCRSRIKNLIPGYPKEAQDYTLEELIEHFSAIRNYFDPKGQLIEFLLTVLNKPENAERFYECKDLITQFLTDNSKLYFNKVDRIKISIEMLELVLYPMQVNQGLKNLCGPASFLMLFFERAPRSCILSFIELLQNGKSSSSVPLTASYLSSYRDTSASNIYLNAIKNASNKFIGYFPFFFEKLEVFAGISEPALLSPWLEACGFSQIIESFNLENETTQIKLYHQMMTTKGIYSKNNIKFSSPLDSLNEAISYANQGKGLIMLLSPDIFFKANSPERKTILNIPIDHYIVVRHLQQSQETVNMVYWSYGKESELKVELIDFLNAYRGFIAADSPIPKEEAYVINSFIKNN